MSFQFFNSDFDDIYEDANLRHRVNLNDDMMLPEENSYNDAGDALWELMEELYCAKEVDADRVNKAIYYLCDALKVDNSLMADGLNVVSLTDRASIPKIMRELAKKLNDQANEMEV